MFRKIHTNNQMSNLAAIVRSEEVILLEIPVWLVSPLRDRNHDRFDCLKSADVAP